MKNNAKLFIISAPSGCGKGTLIAELNKRFDIYNSISCTTRKPREIDKEGVTYFFKTREQFEQMIAEDAFLEHAEFSGNCYGTPKAPVEENLAEGRDVLLEIEPQGAFQVKKKRPDAIMLFILPPSVASIERRLRRRAVESGETEEQIQKRLTTVVPDVKTAYDYDYVMVNADLDKAVEDLVTIFKKAKDGGEGLEAFKADNMKETIDEVLKNA
ncbi:guanylate kinase [Ruminococcus sp. YE71]|uniref:guanylate kinase n=1 Tax=unclassified Ruminococcus TaxID=2608920 RepID=UPI00088C8B8F|nr:MULTISPECIES: guanylate kinase [unclassified Ruminococcus]SDA21033.1 guanylate kinase [Ruminococcus sp. YE78]SFW33126.1 guanylate kinase [Ruminococcus sp. YE71]